LLLKAAWPACIGRYATTIRNGEHWAAAAILLDHEWEEMSTRAGRVEGMEFGCRLVLSSVIDRSLG